MAGQSQRDARPQDGAAAFDAAFEDVLDDLAEDVASVRL
jgi:hypothetical protein